MKLKITRAFRGRGLISPWKPLLGFLAITLLTLSPSQGAHAQNWKVAIVLPITGPLSPIGERLKRGYQLAIHEAQEKGRELQIVWIDERLLEDQKSRQIVSETLKDPAVLAVLGAYSSHATFTLAGIAERVPLPLIIPSSMADRLTRQGYQWVFRVCPSNSQYLKEFVTFLTSLFLSPPPSALIYEDTPWGRELQEKLSGFLKETGGKGPLLLPYTPGGNHYPEIMESLEKKGPSLVILLSSASDTLTLYRNIRLRGLPCLVASGGMGLSYPSLMKEAPPPISGLVFPSPWIPQAPWPEARTFTRNYARFHKSLPDYHAAEAYSSLSVLLTALERGDCLPGTSRCRRKIKRILERETFATPLGPVRFTSREGYTHQNHLAPLIIQIQGRRPVVVYPPRAATGKIQLPREQGPSTRHQR